LLAVLSGVARREQLDPPVALTVRWDDDPSSDEGEWQETVIKALAVTDWEIVRPGDDLDLLGPVATQTLERHGLLWPAPAYAFLPMIQRATGGVLVTGEGGDEVFGLWSPAAVWSKLRRRSRPRVRELLGLAATLTPPAISVPLWRRRERPYQDWLTPAAFGAVHRAIAAELASEGPWWDHYLAATLRRRSVGLLIETLDRLSAAVGARFAAPLLSPAFVASLAAAGGRTGLGGRTEMMTTVFGSVLPPAILRRTSKATFGGVFWGPESRRFADSWDGRGLDLALVEPSSLRRAWLAPLPVYGAALPLHAAWLSGRERTDGGAGQRA